MRRWWIAGSLVAIVAVAVEAEARVGGGQTFSTGSGRSSGGSGGGGEGDLIFLLIRLCIYYPEIGVPLLIGFGLFTLYNHVQDRGDHERVVMESHHAAQHAAPAPRGRRTGWTQLKEADGGLSRPVLYDYLQLVIRRAWAARTEPDRQALEPFVATSAFDAIRSAQQAHGEIDEVVIGSMRIASVQLVRQWTILNVQVTATRRERKDGGEQRVYTEENWVFRRAADARSLPPEDTRRLGCPSCGAAVQCDAMGRCTNCETPITEGQLQWQAVSMATTTRRQVSAPEVGLVSGDEEPSYSAPTTMHPDAAVRLRAFAGRHPDFSQATFRARVEHVFRALQAAWSAGRWQDARPYVTDAAWNTLRFWLDRYEEDGLSNKLADVEVHRLQIADVEVDAWYESITVRIWASMRDWIEDEQGKVVGGNAKTARKFSEYWTFIRAIGTGAGSGDPSACPSCGAPLDNVNAAGVCGYCDSVITTGQFDWVLSRIDQAEVYRPSV